MSRLIGPMFEGSPLLLLPLVALALFLAAFTLIVVRLVVRGSAAFDEAAQAPLEEERVAALRADGQAPRGRAGGAS